MATWTSAQWDLLYSNMLSLSRYTIHPAAVRVISVYSCALMINGCCCSSIKKRISQRNDKSNVSVEAENTVVHLRHVSLGLQQELRLEYKPLFLKDPFEVILSNIYDTNERE